MSTNSTGSSIRFQAREYSSGFMLEIQAQAHITVMQNAQFRIEFNRPTQLNHKRCSLSNHQENIFRKHGSSGLEATRALASASNRTKIHPNIDLTIMCAITPTPRNREKYSVKYVSSRPDNPIKSLEFQQVRQPNSIILYSHISFIY